MCTYKRKSHISNIDTLLEVTLDNCSINTYEFIYLDFFLFLSTIGYLFLSDLQKANQDFSGLHFISLLLFKDFKKNASDLIGKSMSKLSFRFHLYQCQPYFEGISSKIFRIITCNHEGSLVPIDKIKSEF